MSPQDLADLPFAAFLITVGLAFFGLLLSGQLRLKREIEVERERTAIEHAEKQDWKGIATAMTSDNVQKGAQIAQLTEMLERALPKESK